jgi:tetratricopeptide (TPR) repeat protein
MKKRILYTVLTLVFIGGSALVISRYDLKNKDAVYYPLLERKGPQAADWASLQITGEKLMRQVRDDPNDIKNRIALATLYINESRVSGHHDYYEPAAMLYVDEVLQQDPSHFEAMTLKALLLLTQHRFEEGLLMARALQKVNPYNAFVYGLLVDAQVELGQYTEAIKSAEKMMEIRPDIRSYSRVAYLREIHGDIDGAIEAMKLAVDAGGYGDEATEWARVQLAKLYEQKGDIKNAAMQYAIALDERPAYAYAIAGLARLAMHQKDHAKAVLLFEQADGMIQDPSIKEQLAKVYLLSEKNEKGNAIIESLVEEMEKEATGSKANGHHVEKELAEAYMIMQDYDKAYKHALIAYRQRAGNIEVAATLAWASYKTGKTGDALIYIQEALKTGCKNPVLLAHAGLIFLEAGQKQNAKVYMEASLKNNPVMDEELKEELKRNMNNTN